jgi:hypothetical protein
MRTLRLSGDLVGAAEQTERIIPREFAVFDWVKNCQRDIVDGWRPLRYLVYFRSEDQGKLTKFARLSKQMFPYILRYDARSA